MVGVCKLYVMSSQCGGSVVGVYKLCVCVMSGGSVVGAWWGVHVVCDE